MKKKKGFTGLPDLIIAGGIMIASFFFPYLGYRYQKVNSDDDDFEVSSHLLGLSYKYKF